LKIEENITCGFGRSGFGFDEQVIAESHAEEKNCPDWSEKPVGRIEKWFV
jgi:hypothetical protein